MNLKDLTIVVPTYERKSYLIRLIKFWQDENVKLIIIDGSKKSLENSFLKKLSKNINYIHYHASYYKRIRKASLLVKTKFVMFGCDDDFYVKSTLNSCITKLQERKDLISCCGLAIGYNYDNNKIKSKLLFKSLFKNQLLKKSGNERANKHLKNFVPKHFYSVSRTKIWKLIVGLVFSKEYEFLSSYELQLELLFAFAGKTSVIPKLMFLRSFENDGIRNTDRSLNTKIVFEDWWRTENKNKKQFIYEMTNYCQDLNKLLNKKDSINIIENLNYYYDFLKKYKKNFVYVFLLNIFQLFPNNIRFILKKILLKMEFDVNYLRDLKDILNTLSLKKIKFNTKEIEEIENIIINFHIKK